MASDVGICNLALYLLGMEPITAISPPDNTDRARLCAAWYPISRDAVLRAHDWNFAIERQELNLDTPSNPVSGYTYQFVLPTDPYCLRVIEVNEDPTADWVVEGRRLLTDDSTAIIKYLAQITTPGNFDSLFVEALAAKMATNLGPLVVKPPGGLNVVKTMNEL